MYAFSIISMDQSMPVFGILSFSNHLHHRRLICLYACFQHHLQGWIDASLAFILSAIISIIGA
jgi:hypothetical protein